MRRFLACMLIAAWPAVAAAEPLSVILMELLRQQIASAIGNAIGEAFEQSQKEQKPKTLVLPRAQYDLDDAQIQALIEEGFVHLAPAQRREVFASVKTTLADPKNAHLRPVIVQELAVKAAAVRTAHEQLDNLSAAQKQGIAVQARSQFEKMAPEDRQQMLQMLQAGVAPIPRDLNDMILAEFQRVAVADAQPN